MTLTRLRRRLEPAIRPMMHLYWRFARGATLGARGMVIDGSGRVFLVKHSYVDGWHMPGGGVETGETMLTALTRELAEEGNIKLTGQPQLFAVYFNGRVSRRDHVALFIVRDFLQESPPKPNREIVEHGFFALDALPPDTGRATRARLDEVFKGVAVSELW
ncbi:MAG TPA: NUDIX domain-containing protein [Pseudolabrys sp.]|jgi:8-oxo-dGTP pyrophosphatase MutT (NUDIX family)|nr:NUDIX domain-containing protein [Pseudolabrys sp.]